MEALCRLLPSTVYDIKIKTDELNPKQDIK